MVHSLDTMAKLARLRGHKREIEDYSAWYMVERTIESDPRQLQEEVEAATMKEGGRTKKR